MRALLLFLTLAFPVWAGEVPPGPFTEPECLGCHEGYLAKAHGGCIGCHGDRHGQLPQVRKSQACIACHDGPAARSHQTSKHGVIETLEGRRWDWSKPLAEANQRAPACAYCHRPHGRADKEAVCLDCHSPRFVATVAESAKRSLEIGHLKLEEGRAVGGDPAALEKSFSALSFGLAHHSPDFQWWYGHAALDGDLIRLKAAVTRQRRFRP
ncbi:MAG: cytochrome c3 family protein [Magnetospirillum sp. WYHS-4]